MCLRSSRAYRLIRYQIRVRRWRTCIVPLITWNVFVCGLLFMRFTFRSDHGESVPLGSKEGQLRNPPNRLVKTSHIDKISQSVQGGHTGMFTTPFKHHGKVGAIPTSGPRVTTRRYQTTQTLEKSFDWRSQCGTLPPSPIHQTPVGSFVRVGGGSPITTFVFSAFYDNRPSVNGAVRVVGIANGAKGTLYCHLLYAEGTGGREDPGGNGIRLNSPRIIVTPATRMPLSEKHGRSFGGYLYTCSTPIPGVPVGVALSQEKCAPQKKYTSVIDHNLVTLKYNFTVCVTPFSLGYNSVSRFVEHVEINRLFGADRFVYYNLSMGEDVTKVVQSYVQEGLMEVIPWHMPTGIRENIHYFGQVPAENDCLYRNMFLSRYIVFTDLDEFVVPKSTSNWHMMMGEISKTVKPHVSYNFRNKFFHINFSNHPNVTDDKEVHDLNILSLLKVKAETAQPFGKRSKYICSPTNVVMLSVHSVTLALQGLPKNANVPEDIAMLLHYRDWEVAENKEPRHVDMTMYKYKDLIVSVIRDRHSKLAKLKLKNSSRLLL